MGVGGKELSESRSRERGFGGYIEGWTTQAVGWRELAGEEE